MTGWLTTYDGTNKVNLGVTILPTSLFFGSPGSGHWSKVDKETRYKYTSMTYSAAKVAAVAIQGASMETNKIAAVVEQQGDAGAFAVVVCETSIGAWEQEP